VGGIEVTAAGSHGFDMSMDYSVTLELPAEILGSEIGGAISQLSDQDLQKMTVPLPVGITGSFSDPQINLNMETAITSLTQKIIDRQKENLKEKGVDILTGILTGENETSSDTTATAPKKIDTAGVTKEQVVEEVAKNILGEIFGGNKTKKDTATDDQQL
ncbi:MAG TPA: AsmA family protein, partial [Salinimicrobium sp.]|nr:AsmA family protein [Salinimicrobium sp.]